MGGEEARGAAIVLVASFTSYSTGLTFKFVFIEHEAGFARVTVVDTKVVRSYKVSGLIFIICFAILDSWLAKKSVGSNHKFIRAFEYSKFIAIHDLFAVVATESKAVPSVFVKIESIVAA
mgnify:FL=1